MSEVILKPKARDVAKTYGISVTQLHHYGFNRFMGLTSLARKVILNDMRRTGKTQRRNQVRKAAGE